MRVDELGSKNLESKLREGATGDSLLLQLRSDRRLGHEWDDWDGGPLPNGGVFETSERLFFKLAAALMSAIVLAGLGAVWIAGPRLGALVPGLDAYLMVTVGVVGALGFSWLICVAVVLSSGRNWLPSRLAEGGLLPWLMPRLESAARWLGISRDQSGNAMVRVFNRLSVARSRAGIRPEELLILIPRCLGKDAMQRALEVSGRYGVPLFVAARGRYARQMIAMRRPKGIVAVACERDLVSGVHDVGGRLPVLGTTLRLGDGPCRNTEFEVEDLEAQIQTMLGLEVTARPTRV